MAGGGTEYRIYGPFVVLTVRLIFAARSDMLKHFKASLAQMYAVGFTLDNYYPVCAGWRGAFKGTSDYLRLTTKQFLIV